MKHAERLVDISLDEGDLGELRCTRSGFDWTVIVSAVKARRRRGD